MKLSREEQIKGCQKLYLGLRTLKDELVYLQTLEDKLHLDLTEIKIPLYDISYELQKHHDAARDMERDLDEAQQSHFVRQESSFLKEMN